MPLLYSLLIVGEGFTPPDTVDAAYATKLFITRSEKIGGVLPAVDTFPHLIDTFVPLCK